MLCRFLFIALTALILWTNPTLIPSVSEKYRRFGQFNRQYGPWGIVCGASEGLGLEWAHALGERGLNVVLIGRNRTQLERAVDELSHALPLYKFRAIVLDLSNVDEWRKVAKDLADELDIRFLVYNAAYSPVGPFAAYPLDMHEHSIKVNVQSPTIAVSTFLPNMLNKGSGGIVLMSSADGEGCSPLVVNYAGTKSWATHFAQGLWYELAEYNIDVLAVIAGVTATPSLQGVLDPQKRKELLWMLESTPRDVVHEALRALGRQPTVLTGLGTKVVTWFRWLLPRSVGCHAMSAFEHLIKSESELQHFAKATFRPQERAKASNDYIKDAQRLDERLKELLVS